METPRRLIAKWRASADKAEQHIADDGMEIENETHMRDMRMCADELEAASEPPTPPNEMLLNLLAVIHRDGGHYVAEHGVAKASEDAEAIVSRMLPESSTQPATTPGLFGFEEVDKMAKFRLQTRAGEYGYEEVIKAYRDVAQSLLKRSELAAAAPTGQWVKESVRPPSDEQKVLVCDTQDYVHIGYYRPEATAYRFDCDTYGLSSDETKAWQPLPAPPVD